MRPIVYRLRRFVLMLIGALLVVGYGLPYAFRMYLRTKRSPEQNTLVADQMTRPVGIRPEWIEPQPAPPDLVTMLEDESEDWKNHAEAIDLNFYLRQVLEDVVADRPMDADRRTTLSQLVALTSAALESRLAILEHPAYDIDLFMDAPMAPPLGARARSGPGLWPIMVKYAAADALITDNLTSAAAHGMTLLRICRRHPGSKINAHLLSYSHAAAGAGILAVVAYSSDSPEYLRELASEMDLLMPQVDMETFDTTDGLALNILAGLRAYAREGYPVDLATTRTMAGLLEQAIKASYNYGEWITANTPAADPRRNWLPPNATAAASANRFRQIDLFLSPAGMGFRTAVLEILVSNISPSSPREFLQRQRMSQAVLRIARLALASRIFELENGRAVDSMDELVPGHLPAPLIDPFTGKPFLRTGGGMWYSVGPDGVDDKAAMLANPSLQQLDSRGDVFLGKAAASAEGDGVGLDETTGTAAAAR